MARNRLPGVGQGTEQAPAESAVAKDLGGAPGVPIPATEVVAAPRALAGATSRRPRRYRILNGGNIMYGNCRTAMRAGKEISDAQFDIALLKRQGIRLEEIRDEDSPAETPQAAAG
jgi:hypothetical protein